MSLFGEIFLTLFLPLNPFIVLSIVLTQLIPNLPLQKRDEVKKKKPRDY